MKEIAYKLILLIILLAYTVFSTGVFISIHHCCLHCYEKIENVHCNCVEHPNDEPIACVSENKNTHHHCHDDHFFFKILDNYDKKETIFICFLHTQEVSFGQDYRALYETTLSHTIYKEFDESPPFYIKQGRTFVELYQQQVLYA